jgi:2,4-dienoyl-CoA reductase-like NADH-dependent reductase (Old Yellow Enzyme family)
VAVPRALERGEVKDLVQAWSAAARRAGEAGFYMLELHGAHGYLVHAFLSEKSNQRSDEYGGSEINRMRFIIEIAEAVRAQWPDDKPLSGCRWKTTPGGDRSRARGLRLF